MKKIIIQTMLILLLAQAAWAEPVQGLYQAVINVPDQSKATYNQAVKQALRQVLVKVSGNSQVIAVAAIKQDIAQAKQYVNTFSYQPASVTEQNNKASAQESAKTANPEVANSAEATTAADNQAAKASETTQAPQTTASTPAPAWQLEIQFDPQSIDKLLKDAQQPVFGQDRPQVMIWLAEQTTAGHSLVGSGSDSPMVNEVSHLGELRGIDLLLPILDIKDLNEITAEDVWAPYPAVINAASHRYSTDAVLIGRIYPNPNQANVWVSDWHFEQGQQQQEWSNTGDSEQQVLAMGINQMVDNLATQYVSSTRAVDDSQLQVSIYGVDNVAQYSKVSQYLKGISLVNQLKLVTIGEDHVTFNLDLKGNKAQLLQTFAVDHMLQPDTAQQSNQQMLAYRLVS